MRTGLDGKTVVVIGAAGGIGRAVVDAFIDENCSVFAADLDQSVCHQPHGSATGTVVDITQIDQVQKLADAAGDVSHVVFAAAVSSGSVGFPFWNVDPSRWRRVLDVNLIGAVNVAHVLGPILARRGAGSLSFFTSVAGQIGSQTDPPYSASKAALINFTQCVARDLASYGVRANAISPGMVKTDLNRSVWEATRRSQPQPENATYEAWAAAKLKHVCPLGRWQELDEIANAAVFLASDAARNITGQTLNIDGGQVMHA